MPGDLKRLSPTRALIDELVCDVVCKSDPLKLMTDAWTKPLPLTVIDSGPSAQGGIGVRPDRLRLDQRALVMRQGEVFWFHFKGSGSEPAGRRPARVVQDDRFNRSAISTTIVAAITSNLRLAAVFGELASTI